ncbi:hypothetical protein PHYSODRAFT_335423 [Phytophthora sojae]|uniref:Uncharacterized protein n=1 Tax=Phytophthora sojae (strain P6497) TaxID=1094619 RepID=G4ZV50_PHYSP|nr:hypothetical protein PHYSODRAFT_335423 [Phytophthora sojae]EGZ13674.1 hypothetical protein PHYSODRAFT_335423 [Phytophthora sojae]|eukprot:XP_009531103.1 hypothetical protein PHYSODRAFT_335423 [Phytophthora sojae]
MATNVVARDERAQRRAASAERAAAEAARRAKETTEVTVDTGDSSTLTLESSVITSTSGDTPLGSASDGRGGAGSGHPGGDGQAGGGRGRTGRDEGAGSGREPAGGNDGERSTSGSSGDVARSNLTGGDTTPTAGDGGRCGGGHGDDGHGGDGGHGERVGQREAATSFSGDYVDLTGTGGGGGHGGAGPGRASTPPPTLGAARMRAVAAPIVVREKAKALKLTKFKGVDDTMPVSMWLKTVRQEVRRQAVTMGVEWNENQLYQEVASHLEGEAKRWFATVMESVQPDSSRAPYQLGQVRSWDEIDGRYVWSVHISNGDSVSMGLQELAECVAENFQLGVDIMGDVQIA